MSDICGFQKISEMKIEVYQGRTWDTKERFPAEDRPPATETYLDSYIFKISANNINVSTDILDESQVCPKMGEMIQKILQFIKQPAGEREIKR